MEESCGPHLIQVMQMTFGVEARNFLCNFALTFCWEHFQKVRLFQRHEYHEQRKVEGCRELVSCETGSTTGLPKNVDS
jgi:hypothetical protein